MPSIGISAAEAAPGVALAMTHRNAPRMAPPAVFGSSPTAVGPSDLPVMQDDRIHWNGQPIALVLADSQEQADHAASLIRADYAAEPSTTSFEAAVAKGTEPGVFQGQVLSSSTRPTARPAIPTARSSRTRRRSPGKAIAYASTTQARW